MTAKQPPLVVSRAIAIRNKYGYGAELKYFYSGLSEAEKQIVEQWLNPGQEIVGAAAAVFRQRLDEHLRKNKVEDEEGSE